MAPKNFRFDRRAFEKSVQKAVAQSGARLGSRASTVLNGMSREFAGRPVEEIKPVLQQRWRAAMPGGDITDPELSNYAAKISAGETFVVNVRTQM